MDQNKDNRSTIYKFTAISVAIILVLVLFISFYSLSNKKAIPPVRSRAQVPSDNQTPTPTPFIQSQIVLFTPRDSSEIIQKDIIRFSWSAAAENFKENYYLLISSPDHTYNYIFKSNHTFLDVSKDEILKNVKNSSIEWKVMAADDLYADVSRFYESETRSLLISVPTPTAPPEQRNISVVIGAIFDKSLKPFDRIEVLPIRMRGPGDNGQSCYLTPTDFLPANNSSVLNHYETTCTFNNLDNTLYKIRVIPERIITPVLNNTPNYELLTRKYKDNPNFDYDESLITCSQPNDEKNECNIVPPGKAEFLLGFTK